jgi:outer membrane protein assembly factor BamA
VDVRFEPVSPPPAGAAAGVGDGTLSVDAVVAVEEPRKYQFVYGVEVSNQYGPVFDDVVSAVGAAADVRDRNVFGRGFSFSMGGRYERNLASLRSMFSIPTLRGRRIQTNVFGSWTTERKPGEGGSTADTGTLGGSIEQRWHPRNWLDLSWGYTFEDQRFDIITARVPDAVPQQLGATLASLNVATILDHRDSVFDAKRGWFHASSLQQGVRGLGSDLGYTRYLGRLYYFGRLGPVVSASAVRFGSLWKGGGTNPYSAPDLLFKAGGSQTVRGYSQDSLSAIMRDGIPLGGTRLLIANQELRVSVNRWLGGVIFADAGNTFGNQGIVLRDLAVGLGFGVRITTPLAPLRIDFGFPVPRRPGDPRYRWYISIGQMF